MNIQVNSLDELFEHINQEGVVCHLDTIYCSKLVRSLTEKHESVSESVMIGIQVTTVLLYDDGSQALLQYGDYLDKDLRTSDGYDRGSQAYLESRKALELFCSEQAIKLLPGIVSAD